MKIALLYAALMMFAYLEVSNARRCRKIQRRVEEGRKCRRPCVVDGDCKAPNKTCNCDGQCGKSCYNPNALCDELEPIPNGSMDLNAITMQSTVSYTCDYGFVMRGDRVRTCRADKKWYPKAPVCRRGCKRPAHIGNSYPLLNGTIYDVGNEVTYRCLTGYYTYDEGPMTVSCLESGQWSVGRFSCELQMCDPVPEIIGGRVTYTSQYYFGSIATLVCINGYEPKGGVLKRYCEAGRQDDSSAEWSEPSLAKCTRKRCPPPRKPENGFVNYEWSTADVFGTEIRYSCIDGYRLEGGESGRCNEDSTWGVVPECVEITCETPPTSLPFTSNGTVGNTESGSFRLASTVTYKCIDQYTLSGHESSTSFTSTCKRVSAMESVWFPSFANVRCEADVNCTFKRSYCSYTNSGWRYRYSNNWIYTARYNAILTSPWIYREYAIRGYICVVFEYYLEDRSSTLLLQKMSSQSKQTVWTSHPKEMRRAWLTSFAKFPIEQNLQYRFQSTASRLNFVELRKTDCEYSCMSTPCMNGGTCVNRLKSYTCFCPTGYSGEQCQWEITCDPPPTALPFTSNRAELGLFRIGSTVTYQCLDHYTLSGHESSTSFSSTCKRVSTVESVWIPSFANVRCEDTWISTAQYNAILTSPRLHRDYAISGYICVVFEYYLYDDPSSTLLMKKMSSQSQQTAWTSHPKEKRRAWLQSFAKFPIEQNFQYQFQATASRLKFVELRKMDCEDLCMSHPCMNGGTCVNRLKSYTCFCPTGFSGKRCHQADVNCTFTRSFCGFTNDGWRFYHRENWIYAAQYESTLTSTPINLDYAITGHICVVFKYYIHPYPHDSTLSLQQMSQSRPAWESHLHEKRGDWLTSFVNFRIEQNLRFQFKSTRAVALKFVEVRRTDCKNWCISEPCINGGTCVNRLNSYTCFCPRGLYGEHCQYDDFCMTEPCMNGGTCVKNWKSYSCRCSLSSWGAQCQYGF